MPSPNNSAPATARRRARARIMASRCHCERSEAIQPRAKRANKKARQMSRPPHFCWRATRALDCFVASLLAMTPRKRKNARGGWGRHARGADGWNVAIRGKREKEDQAAAPVVIASEAKQSSCAPAGVLKKSTEFASNAALF